MDAASQQRILGYFIEEANEHLSTLEKGILELSTVVRDSERINEMFRAAHSIKGGAAMLGYGSIQKIAHRLEDAFKVIRENSISVDQRLEALFLEVYDLLQDLIGRLQKPEGLANEEAEQVVAEAEPSFAELQAYLKRTIQGSASTLTEAQPVARPAMPNRPQRVRQTLKQMLTLFKQKATPENRQQLQQLCSSLIDIAPQATGWQTLVESAEEAIANPLHSYRTLAPVVITELKEAGDRLDLEEEMAPSQSLQKLARASLPQILISLEPQSAARTLRGAFNQQQLSQLVQFLSQSGTPV